MMIGIVWEPSSTMHSMTYDLVPVNGWEEMLQEPTKHDFDDLADERYHSTPP